MPELPEVQTIASQLNNKLAGKKIEDVEVMNPSSFVGPAALLKGERVLLSPGKLRP